MGEQQISDTVTSTELKLLSVASLSKRIHNNISLEELHSDASRKFDTLVELLGDTYNDNSDLDKFGYSLDELKQLSHMIFSRLISEEHNNPFLTLCVPEGTAIEEIKRRRNMLLHIFHPDRNNVDISSESKTRKINDAYEQISILYNEATIPTNANHTNIPPSYPYVYSNKRQSPYLIIFILIFIFAIFGIMIKTLIY